MPKHKFHELTDEELEQQLKTKKEEFLKKRFQRGINKILQNPAEYKKLKKDIARILTILSQRKKEKIKG